METQPEIEKLKNIIADMHKRVCRLELELHVRKDQDENIANALFHLEHYFNDRLRIGEDTTK